MDTEEKKTKKENSPIECCEVIRTRGDKQSVHFHEYIQLVYLNEGELDIHIGSGLYRMLPGELCIISAFAPHYIESLKKKSRYTVIKFLSGIICDTYYPLVEMKYLLPFLSNSRDGRVIEATFTKKASVASMFASCLNESQSDNPGKQLAMRAAVLNVFIFIIRYWETEGFRFEPSKSDGDLIKVMERAVEYMAENLVDVNEKEIAEMCGLSYSYFSRSFKRIMHMSFSEYYNKMKIRESEKLLAETDMPINEIAISLGFSSASHYIQTFRRFRECSPKKYRGFVQSNR